ncbi:MAG: hypothetical protein QNJ22_05880 [Desulfosarcinaceae bacterium]|nr:hypothetical protein [Desulfosarcinaceae bacterium]
MKNRYTQPGVLLSIILMLSLLLAACGGSSGGGGGGNSDYAGNSDAAVVTSGNAQEIAVSAYDSSALEGPFGELASLSTGTSSEVATQGRPIMLAVSDALQTALFKADPAEATASAAVRAAVTIEDTISGSCGGSASFTIQADDTTGTFSGSFSFTSFCEDDTTLSGLASFSGSVDPETEELESFTFTLSNLSGTSDGESFRLNGQLSISVLSNPSVLTLDLLFEDLGAGETFWLDDFTIRVTENFGYEEVSISGRVYHPEHGYVDIATTTPFRTESGDDYPSQGVMVLTGADNAKIRMTVLSNTQYQLEADTDGDGEFDDYGPEVFNWEE